MDSGGTPGYKEEVEGHQSLLERFSVLGSKGLLGAVVDSLAQQG
jgi:hypothetical protein